MISIPILAVIVFTVGLVAVGFIAGSFYNDIKWRTIGRNRMKLDGDELIRTINRRGRL